MDIYKKLGALALSSRLRRLSENMAGDVTRIYKKQNINFEARWFVLYQKLLQGPIIITELATAVGMTHAAIHITAREMERAGLVVSGKDKGDGRKRVLKLTLKGLEIAKKLDPLWKDIQKANEDFLAELDMNFLEALEKVEASLEKRDMSSRIEEQIRKRIEEEIKIVSFEKKWSEAFKELNFAWLKKYFTIEALDRKVL